MTASTSSLAALAVRLAAAGALSAACVLPAVAASSASSAASDSVTTSVGSLSNSVQRSSDSSSNDNKVADGDYRIIDIAAAADRPGLVRLKLQALADATPNGELFLFVPQDAVAQGRLAAGGIVTARQQRYGIEFADGRTHEAFFLALHDDWVRELQTTAL